MTEIEVGFPFQLDSCGSMSSPGYDRHIEQLIEQVLFTSPGERVNRPDFGCSLLRTVFTSITPEEVAAVQYVVQTALQRWLSDLIQLKAVRVTVPAPTSLEITVEYVVLRDLASRTSNFRYQSSS